MDPEGASNSMSRIHDIPCAFYAPGRHIIADERLLAAAKDDNEDLLLDFFDDDDPNSFDINFQDGFVRYLQSDFRSLLSFRL